MTIDAITPGARVLCAVSGGVDSMYLLHRMTELAAQRGFTVGCAASIAALVACLVVVRVQKQGGQTR